MDQKRLTILVLRWQQVVAKSLRTTLKGENVRAGHQSRHESWNQYYIRSWHFLWWLIILLLNYCQLQSLLRRQTAIRWSVQENNHDLSSIAILLLRINSKGSSNLIYKLIMLVYCVIKINNTAFKQLLHHHKNVKTIKIEPI